MIDILHFFRSDCRWLVWVATMVCLTVGCSPSGEPGSKLASDMGTSPPKASPARESTDPVSPGSPEEAKRMLEGSLAKYQKFTRYRDAAELVIQLPGKPPVVSPFRVAWERPNRLALAVHGVQGTWTSTTWEGIGSGPGNPFPNQRVVRPLPDRIDRAWVVSDFLGGLLMDSMGVPIQLEWLLSDQTVAALSDPGCKVEFLQRDTASGRSCDRVRMELHSLRWTVWIDRENQLVRRMELPPTLFFPGVPPDQLEGVRCEIDLSQAVADQEIDWSEWQIPSRPEDILVRRMVMPPPIASTQILGATLAPFDLKSADGRLLFDAAEPKRPVSLLCWVDDSPRSEAIVRELMVFNRELVEKQIGGRCGVFLIAQGDSAKIGESLKRWNCDLPLADDAQGISKTVFKIDRAPSLVVLDRDRRVQVAENLSAPLHSGSLIELVRKIEAKEDLASRQLQQDADNQARFIAALHRVAIDRDQAQRIDPIREFQFSLHGMRRAWRTELEAPLVSAGGAWYPETAVSSDLPNGYPFSGTAKPSVMSAMDETGKVFVFDDLGNRTTVGLVEIEQADGAKRIHMAIDPWTRQWIAVVPEGLPRFWMIANAAWGANGSAAARQATTYNTTDVESPTAFAWAAMESEPVLTIATSESRLLVVNPKTEKRLDALGESTIAIAPALDASGRVVQWNALGADGRMQKIRNLSGLNASAVDSPIDARLEQLTFAPRAGAWMWGRHDREAVTLCLGGLPSGETGVVVCNHLHQPLRNRSITALPEQARLLSSVRLPDGTLYCLAYGPNRVLHLFTADLQIMDQVSFDARVFAGALFADGEDLKMVVALDKEISAWSIDVPNRSGGATGTGDAPGTGGATGRMTDSAERIAPAGP